LTSLVKIKAMKLSLVLTILLVSNFGYSQTAKEIIKLSIEYHDPENKLATGDYDYHFDETRANGTVSTTKVRLAPKKEQFSLAYTRKNIDQGYVIDKDNVSVTADGKSDLSEDFKKENRISEDRGIVLKNYYLYLWQLPMKLEDPGTIVHPEVVATSFFGTESLQIKVTYEKQVGDDIWYFYFDPSTYKMVGYRFYHDESANDGEYILIEGEYEKNNIRIPAKRKWYMHTDDKFLGTDELVLLKARN